MSLAALAFDRELRRLGVEADESLGRRAARAVASASVWEQALGPMLTSAQVQDLLGISREALRQRVASRAVLALPTEHPRRHLYPAFQFDGRRVVAGLPEVLNQFFEAWHGPGTASVSPHTVASWMVAPKSALDGLAPVTALRRPRLRGMVVRLARQAAARLAR